MSVPELFSCPNPTFLAEPGQTAQAVIRYTAQGPVLVQPCVTVMVVAVKTKKLHRLPPAFWDEIKDNKKLFFQKK